MSPLHRLYQNLKTLCSDLFTLRHWPRPEDEDWRKHKLSLTECRQKRDKCDSGVASCIKALDEARRHLPKEWLEGDPQIAKYIRLKRSLERIGFG